MSSVRLVKLLKEMQNENQRLREDLVKLVKLGLLPATFFDNQACGYCGNSKDPNDICDDCFDKMPPAECYCDSKTLLDYGCQCGGI